MPNCAKLSGAPEDARRARCRLMTSKPTPKNWSRKASPTLNMTRWLKARARASGAKRNKRGVIMHECEVCGNDYDKPMEITVRGETHYFDCFECAIHALAPQC